MRITTSAHRTSSLLFRPLPLAACLAAACGVSVSAAQSAATAHAPLPRAMTRTVDTCADDNSANSLRSLIAIAGEDDTIDLTHLPAGCSKITLSSTHSPQYLEITRNTLYLQGPGADLLSIDGNFEASVLRHTGTGTLHISGLTIAHGSHISDMEPRGGCVHSLGNIRLVDSVVTGCEVGGTGAISAMGGGVHAAGSLYLDGSSITDNTVTSLSNAYAFGGGASAVGTFGARLSSIANNRASGSGGAYGGGVFVLYDATVRDSTISGNNATVGGGLYSRAPSIAALQIINSTISGNSADVAGGISSPSQFFAIRNSTIAFNHDTNPFSLAAGVTFGGVLTLESSILSGNDGWSGAADLGGSQTPVQGTHNIIVAANAAVNVPDGTIHSCPHLQMLADNGGPTLTHKPMHDSPAIDVGSNSLNLPKDQTQAQRTIGADVDIGSVEWDGATDERIFVGGFDGLCDR
jgi:hypothetical protein